MICDRCGAVTAVKAEKDPWCMYRLEGDKVINKLFDPDKIPSGWYDSPRAAMAGKTTAEKMAATKAANKAAKEAKAEAAATQAAYAAGAMKKVNQDVHSTNDN